MTLNIAIAGASGRTVEVKSLASQYHLPFIEKETDFAKYDYVLYLGDLQLELHQPHQKTKPFVLNLIAPRQLYRYQKVSMKRELIARAMGIKPLEQPYIVDATAGFARDSIVLAAFGYQVTMLEQSAIIFLLVSEALERAKQNIHAQVTVNRLNLIHTDACEWLANQELKPDIIYLDPMFPTRQKSSAVKKESMILQQLLQNHRFDNAALFKLALSCAKRRVVVKRPRLASPLEGKAADFSIQGKTIRFDIYLPKN